MMRGENMQEKHVACEFEREDLLKVEIKANGKRLHYKEGDQKDLELVDAFRHLALELTGEFMTRNDELVVWISNINKNNKSKVLTEIINIISVFNMMPGYKYPVQLNFIGDGLCSLRNVRSVDIN